MATKASASDAMPFIFKSDFERKLKSQINNLLIKTKSTLFNLDWVIVFFSKAIVDLRLLFGKSTLEL